MTVVEEVPLYVRDGSRFVLYDEARQHTPPIPVPVAIPGELLGEDDPDGWNPEAVPTRERPTVRVGVAAWRVYAPRCPHERFRGCRVRGCPGPS
jgi:hypothetical protein